MTIQDAIDAYLLHHQATNSQPKTLEWHTHCLGAFRAFCDEASLSPMEDVTTEQAQRWVISLQKAVVTSRGKRSARTVNWYFRSLRAFYRWCLHRGFIEEDVTAWLELPKVEKPLIRILEAEEFERLLVACSVDDLSNRSTGAHHVARNEAILWLLYDTGIRLAELKTTDFDRARGTIIVYGKGRKERKIALGRNALQVVGRYLTYWRQQFPSANEVQQFFLTEQGGITREGIKMLFRRLRLRGGFTDRRVHPHLLRHTFAVRYLMSGGDVFSLQELLGHEDMETIRNYMHLADANVQAQKRKFSPGDQIQLTSRKANRTGFRKAKE
ncbi:MAG: tyrosine-type recombinase/integrase [Ktedonobacterales bacterium]|nr:tyrosine-type recombinase/integrase [Ktedonobacterales bacterium]